MTPLKTTYYSEDVSHASEFTALGAAPFDRDHSVIVHGSMLWVAQNSANLPSPNAFRAIRDHSHALRPVAGGVELVLASNRDTAESSRVSYGVLSCEDDPDGAFSFEVKNNNSYQFSGAGARTTTATNTNESRNAITDPNKCLVFNTGHAVAKATTDSDEVPVLFIQDAAGVVTARAASTYAQTSTSYCTQVEVTGVSADTVYCAATQAEATAARAIMSSAPAYVGGSNYAQYALVIADHPVETLYNQAGAGATESSPRVWKAKEAITGAAANFGDELSKWELVGFPGTCFELDLYSDCGASTTPATIPSGWAVQFLPDSYVYTGSASGDDVRPVNYTQPVLIPSVEPGKVIVRGNFTLIPGDLSFPADGEYYGQGYLLEGAETVSLAEVVGPSRTDETFGFEPEDPTFNNSSTTSSSFDLGGIAEENSDVWAYLFGATNERQSTNLVNLDQQMSVSASSVGASSGINNLLRDQWLLLNAISFRSLSALPKFDAVYSGDVENGGSITLTATGALEFADPVSHLEVVGAPILVSIVADSGADKTNAVISHAAGFGDFAGASAQWRFVIPDTEQQFEAVSTTGERSAPFSITSLSGAGVANKRTTLTATQIAAYNPGAMLNEFTGLPALPGVRFMVDSPDVSDDSTRENLPGTPVTNEITWYSSSVGWSSAKSCEFDPTTVTALQGQISSDFSGVADANPVTLGAPWVDIDGSGAQALAGGIKSAVASTAKRLRYNQVISGQILEAIGYLNTSEANASVMPALLNAAGEGYTVTEGNGGQLNLVEVSGPAGAAVLSGSLAAGTYAGGPTPVVLRLDTSTDALEVLIPGENPAVKASTTNSNYTVDAGGLVLLNNNTNGACVTSFAANGYTPLAVASAPANQTVALNAAQAYDLASIFNAGWATSTTPVDDTNIASAYGWPTGTTIAGDTITLNTSTPGTYDVTFQAIGFDGAIEQFAFKIEIPIPASALTSASTLDDADLTLALPAGDLTIASTIDDASLSVGVTLDGSALDVSSTLDAANLVLKLATSPGGLTVGTTLENAELGVAIQGAALQVNTQLDDATITLALEAGTLTVTAQLDDAATLTQKFALDAGELTTATELDDAATVVQRVELIPPGFRLVITTTNNPA